MQSERDFEELCAVKIGRQASQRLVPPSPHRFYQFLAPLPKGSGFDYETRILKREYVGGMWVRIQ